MAFLNPLFLWAFLGLTVPVAIHLWSRKEGRTIKVGSIQFLKDSDTKQASSIKLNEIWLLLLRMLAISLLVLIIAGPVLIKRDSRSAVTYLVEPSLLQHEKMGSILDTLDSAKELKLLAQGFPDYNRGDEIKGEEVPDYWQLAGEMSALNSDSIVVFTAAYASGFKGRRPPTGQNINWIQIIPDEDVSEPIAVLRKGDDFEIISVSGDHTRLGIEKETLPVNNNRFTPNATLDSISIDHNGSKKIIPLRVVDTVRVSLYNDEHMQEQMNYIRSSLRAISVYLGTPIKIQDYSGKNSTDEDLMVWLSTSPHIETQSPVLLWKPDSLANALIVQGNKNNVYYLTGALNSENTVEGQLPEQLLELLNIHSELEEEIIKLDRRVMPLEEIIPVSASLSQKIEISNTRDISKYLWILLVIFLIMERGLSVYRKQ